MTPREASEKVRAAETLERRKQDDVRRSGRDRVQLSLTYRNGFNHTLTVWNSHAAWELAKAMLATMPNPPVSACTIEEKGRMYSVIEGGELI